MHAIVFVVLGVMGTAGCQADEDKVKKNGLISKPVVDDKDAGIKQESLAELRKIVEKLRKQVESAEPKTAEDMKVTLKEIEKWIEEETKKGKAIETSKKRAYLGISPKNLSEEDKDELGTNGVKIFELIPDTPAHKAGLEVDDVITHVDDRKIESQADLVKIIQSKKPGDEVTIRLLREKETKSVKAILGTFPDDQN
jgi:S1-C subfamily serine protease